MDFYFRINSLKGICIYTFFYFILSFTTNIYATEASGIFKEKFNLLDENSKLTNFEDFKEKTIVMTMAYTECTKTCPRLTIAKLKELQSEFDKRKIPADFVVITFDSDHDKPAALLDYKKKQKLDRPNWHFLVGNKEQTHQVADYLSMNDYWQMDDHIIHSFRILIFNESRNLDHVFDFSHRDLKEYFNKTTQK